MMNWLKRLFYRKKRFDVEQALRDMLHRGIEIGKRQAEPIIIERRACRLHPVVLLNEIGPGHYICPLCQEERNTDRIPQPRMMNIYNDARRTGASPNTAIQKSVRLTQDLSKYKGEMR